MNDKGPEGAQLNDDQGIWQRVTTEPVAGDYGPTDIHMCTLCHALTPRNNSGAHYRWHQEQLDLVKAVYDAGMREAAQLISEADTDETDMTEDEFDAAMKTAEPVILTSTDVRITFGGPRTTNRPTR